MGHWHTPREDPNHRQQDAQNTGCNSCYGVHKSVIHLHGWPICNAKMPWHFTEQSSLGEQCASVRWTLCCMAITNVFQCFGLWINVITYWFHPLCLHCVITSHSRCFVIIDFILINRLANMVNDYSPVNESVCFWFQVPLTINAWIRDSLCILH